MPFTPTAHRLQTLYIGVMIQAGPGFDTGLLKWDDLYTAARGLVTDAVFFRDYGFRADGQMLQAIEYIINTVKPLALHIPDGSLVEPKLLAALRARSEVVIQGVTR